LIVDDDLSNFPHHGEIRQPRTMAAMAIFGRIPQPHQPKPLKKILDESGLAEFYEKLLFNKVLDNLLSLSFRIIRSCHQRGMVVAMAINNGFGGCYFTDRF
jgi:hypothetical protein